MPGPRQKLSVLESTGRKHLSKSEKAQRAAQEVNLPKPKRLQVPKWLPAAYRKEFRALGKELLEADLGVAQLDADTLGRYVVAAALYEETTAKVNEMMANAAKPREELVAKLSEVMALDKPDPKDLAELMGDIVSMDVAAIKGVSETIKQQNTFFAQARACANDLGMTITSRCRLVLPEGARPKEPNAFEKMMEERMRRA